MNGIQLLKEDHKKARGLFQQLENDGEDDPQKREKLFAELKQELDIHAHIEETIFYPALKKEAETRDITLEGLEEHHVMKVLLRELEANNSDGDRWMPKLKVLMENVIHHVQEEEGEMFIKAQEVLGEERINELGAQMLKEKQAQQKGASAGR